jgi:hypothetical protein
MIGPRRSLLRLLVVLAYLGVSAPAPTILCVGPDGHREIELARSLTCHPGAGTSAVGVTSAGDDGCPSDCSDTPLWTGAAVRDEQSSNGVAARHPRPIAAAAVVSSPSMRAESTIARARTSAAPAPNDCRSAILRC